MKILALTLLTLFSLALPAEEHGVEITIDSSAQSTPATQKDNENADEDEGPNENEVVSFGQDASLAAGDKSSNMVALLGSITSAGEVFNDVVAVLGNVRSTGPVGSNVVAVLGNVYINNHVGGGAVAVLGNIELGPQASIDGDVVAVGGNLKRDPAAQIHGNVNHIKLPIDFAGVHAWIKECLRYGRVLAFAPGLAWAWALALGALASYVLLALGFRESMDRCVKTLETHPGRSLLAAILAMLLTPVLFILLVITVVGILAVPFLALALLMANIFGKGVMLAWLGRRFTIHFGEGALSHTAVAVLLGGIIMLLLYTVPVLGFIAFNVLGMVGLGVVIYTLILNVGRKQPTLESATLPPAAPSLPIDTLQRAGFWIRMGALFLDIVLIGIVLTLIRHSGHLEVLVLAVYGAVMWKLRGSTIGGIICGLKVVRLDGRAVDWPTAIVRALGCFLSLALAGLGFFWIAFDDGKQAWHDKIAGTAVVRAPKGASLV